MHPLERRFQDSVIDARTAQEEIRSFFGHTIRLHPLMMVVGPEGVGKTSAVMALHHEVIEDLERRGESPLAMYAFADYAAAEQKCAAFNALQAGNGFFGVVLPSFSRAYEQACTSLDVQPISTEEAGRHGFASQRAAVRKLQPQVTEVF